jgi:hypothetical protein
MHEFSQLHSEETEALPPGFEQVLDWFVLEGAETDEVIIMQEEIHNLLLGEIEYFVGPPTCWSPGYYVEPKDGCITELGALAVLSAPYEADQLRAMTAHISHDVDQHFLDLEISDDSSGSVWVMRRFTQAQLDSEDFHDAMQQFVELSIKVRAAVLSGGR